MSYSRYVGHWTFSQGFLGTTIND
uniref:Uncharacterized protein n=1 Tax=Anguilla anguilla TaxID=7936 RepID=A0A0E9W5P1_ANGAN